VKKTLIFYSRYRILQGLENETKRKFFKNETKRKKITKSINETKRKATGNETKRYYLETKKKRNVKKKITFPKRINALCTILFTIFMRLLQHAKKVLFFLET
jgi:hypothetical protein